MIHDPQDVQSKFDRPAADAGAVPGPAALPAPAVVPAPPAPAVEAVVPAVMATAVTPAGAPVRSQETRAPGPAADGEDEVDDDVEPLLTLADRLRRLSPALVILTAGSIGSLLFMARAVTSHTTPVAVLMSAGVVTGLIFGADSVIASVATYRAAQNGEGGRAVLLALVGGVSAVVCAGALAGTAVMILVLNG
jgi:hypothetical protein